MIVYVVNSEYAYGTYSGSNCVGVYDSREKAEKVMKDQIENIKNRWAYFKDAGEIKMMTIEDRVIISSKNRSEAIKIEVKKVY